RARGRGDHPPGARRRHVDAHARRPRARLRRHDARRDHLRARAADGLTRPRRVPGAACAAFHTRIAAPAVGFLTSTGWLAGQSGDKIREVARSMRTFMLRLDGVLRRRRWLVAGTWL